MREYDELYDWLAQSKLLAYMDNFAAAGFDLSAMVGLTPEVSSCKCHSCRDCIKCNVSLTNYDIFYL